jgi:uncharacterized phage infection (PIP) family protein YhgE
MKLLTSILAALAIMTVVSGCGGKADANKPIEEIKAEVQQMDAAALQKKVDAYTAAIASKEAEVKKLADKIKEIPVEKMLGDEAKKLKASADELKAAAKALGDRLQVYADALKAQAATAR